jgi:hypothetical protein
LRGRPGGRFGSAGAGGFLSGFGAGSGVFVARAAPVAGVSGFGAGDGAGAGVFGDGGGGFFVATDPPEPEVFELVEDAHADPQ